MRAGSIWWAGETSLGVPAWALVNRKRVWNILIFCAASGRESFKKYDPSSSATPNTEIWFKSRPACVTATFLRKANLLGLGQALNWACSYPFLHLTHNLEDLCLKKDHYVLFVVGFCHLFKFLLCG